MGDCKVLLQNFIRYVKKLTLFFVFAPVDLLHAFRSQVTEWLEIYENYNFALKFTKNNFIRYPKYTIFRLFKPSDHWLGSIFTIYSF